MRLCPLCGGSDTVPATMNGPGPAGPWILCRSCHKFVSLAPHGESRPAEPTYPDWSPGMVIEVPSTVRETHHEGPLAG